MDIETQRRELAANLAGMREAAEANGGKIADLDAAVRGFKTQLQTMEASQAEANARAYEPTGTDRELKRYMGANAADLKANARNYVQKGDEAVRLRGHVSRAGGYLPGLLDDPNARTEWQREFQQVVTTRNLVRLARSNRDGSHRGSPIMDAACADMMRAAPPGLARIFADAATGAGIHGADLIPDQALPELERAVQFTSGVADLFETRGMPAGGLFRLPFTGGNIFPSLKVAATGNDPANAPLSDWASDNNTIEAKSLVAATQLDREATEEALIAVMPEVMMTIARAWQFGKDNVCINGHAAGTQDALASWDIRGIWGAQSATNHHLKLADGLRADAIATSTAIDQNAAQDADGARALLKTLGARFFSDLSDIVFLVSPEYLLGTMLGFSEVKTWDQIGSTPSVVSGMMPGGAGALPGSVGVLYGVPVVVTPFLSADLNASGVYDNVTTNLTGIIAVSRSKYEWRQRHAAMIETDTEIRNDTVTVVSRMKTLFRKRGDTSDKSAAYGYNLTS
ncbi:MAG: hypothetical protein KAQ88_01855 [Hyphomicrobiaceae bacterium]|nr:hypothetical protein [Hyphomicrobiaceae bacterium]